MDDSQVNTALRRMRDKIAIHGDSINSEDAIKAVLVQPFLASLGHDVSDPDKVQVSPKSDTGRADYVVLGDNGPVMYVAIASDPQNPDSARARALSRLAAETRAAVLLTDGRSFMFHVIDQGVIADDPFLAFNVERDDVMQQTLAPLARGEFHLDQAVTAGRATRLDELAWERMLAEAGEDGEIRQLLARLVSPNGEADERSLAGAATALERIASLMREEMNEAQAQAEEIKDDQRPLTGDEMAAFELVRAMVNPIIGGGRLFARPAKTYLAVLLDDNNRRTLCRLYFRSQSARYVGTFVEREETRHKVDHYSDVADYEAQIEARLRELDPGAFNRTMHDDDLSLEAGARPVLDAFDLRNEEGDLEPVGHEPIVPPAVVVDMHEHAIKPAEAQDETGGMPEPEVHDAPADHGGDMVQKDPQPTADTSGHNEDRNEEQEADRRETAQAPAEEAPKSNDDTTLDNDGSAAFNLSRGDDYHRGDAVDE